MTSEEILDIYTRDGKYLGTRTRKECHSDNPGFYQNDNHPVTNLSWEDADAFCEWLSNKTGQDIQLPTTISSITH